MKIRVGDLVYYHEKELGLVTSTVWTKEIGVVVDTLEYIYRPEWGDVFIVMLASNKEVVVPPRCEDVRYITLA